MRGARADLVCSLSASVRSGCIGPIASVPALRHDNLNAIRDAVLVRERWT